MEAAQFITVVVTLFVVIDPIGLTPMFVALTQGADPATRRAFALRACFTAAVILTLFGVLGEAVLGFVGISLPAFRIAGGILLFLTALEMLFERRDKRRSDQPSDRPDPSIFPLAIPLIAGPGSITTMILLTGKTSSVTGLIEVHLAMVAVVICVLVLFLAAGALERLLGKTGINVVTRLLGMLLAALAVQFVVDGVHGLGY
jgi:multiple antibiotic resistance protein